jgi:hypothetical protein
METSLVTFHQRGFWVRNDHLCLWLEALGQAIDQQSVPSAWLLTPRHLWHMQAVSCAATGGSAFVDLDPWVKTEQHKGDLLLLCEQAINNLLAEGEMLSADRWNARLRDESISPKDNAYFSQELPTETFLQIARAFLRLLQAEVFPIGPPFPALG